MASRTKLELTWIGKNQRPRLEPRILLEEPERSHQAKKRVSEKDIFDNRLIFGDNLLALKALEQEFAGAVKCVFIDPPYNTGSAFTHYDDGLEHSIWLSLMRDRLEVIHRLMSEDGSLWITIDDNEAHYLKIVCDEVFGRTNFVCSAIWEKKYSPQGNAQWLSDSHDFILVYAKQKAPWTPNLLARTDEMDGRYKNPDNDPRGPWKAVDATISLSGGQRGAQYARTGVSPNLYELTTPSGRKLWPAKGRCWYYTPEKMQEAISDGRIWFGETGNNVPAVKKFITDVKQGVTAKTIWFRSEVGDNQEAKQEALSFNSDSVFSTPKPERLIERVLTLATNPGDLVLDSFAGSGTTGAVAQKMGRRWIMVELGEHCHTHIIPRLKKVIDGEDSGGVTKATGWKGGGGFRYFKLAPSLLSKDAWGNWVISKGYNAAMLAEAMCKLHGFVYEPSQEQYWKQGRSSESDFIYVTTQTLNQTQLRALSEEVGEKETLLVCCGAFRVNADDYPNLTLKKIPQSVLAKCEWGHDDYSLNIQNLPSAPDLGAVPAAPPASAEPTAAPRRRGRPPRAAQPSEGTQALGLEGEE